MLWVYTTKDLLPMPLEQKFNEVFFRMNITFSDLTPTDFEIIDSVDNAKFLSDESFKTPFGIIKIVNLSTGCKTVINALHYPKSAFNLVECGDNAFTKLAEVCCNSEIDIHALLPDYRELQSEDIVLRLNGTEVKGADAFYAEWRRIEREGGGNG